MPVRGYIALVLHAHLPYVRHPEHPEFLEEDWLFEAITETYLPILDVFERLVRERVDFRMTMTMSPTLCEMLCDPLLQERYLRHLGKLLDLADREVHRTRMLPELHDTALMYQQRFRRALEIFEGHYQRNLVRGFKNLQDLGKLEVLTCAATHGFLPLMLRREAVRAQVEVGCQNYMKHFGRRPRGIWLPECGYSPGDDRLLHRAGIEYFMVDTHGLLFGSPRPRYGVHAPVRCHSGVAAFARDIESSKQVWSAKEGYPGDGVYREFYRDLGYDAEYPYIRPFLHSDGVRRNIGIKYYKVTGEVELHEKQPYRRADAIEKAALHAGNFLFNRQAQVKHLEAALGRRPIIVAPYDAELFGHWWFEGPEFLDFFLRKTSCDQEELALTTPAEYLRQSPRLQTTTPSMSTWGSRGYAEMWLNPTNDWCYRHLHEGEERMVDLARRFPTPPSRLHERALKQAAREFLLAQSSDWPFIMSTGTMVPYAQNRFRTHMTRFLSLHQSLVQDSIDVGALAEMESKDAVFQEIDYRVYLP